MRQHKSLKQSEDGAAAIEMAIAVPVLILFLIGIVSFGQILEAQAGMQHALGEGARLGTLCLNPATGGSCTLPSSTQIRDRVNSKLFGTNNGTFDSPNVDTTTASSGYVTITVTYHQAMNFAFFSIPSMTFTQSKLVYLAETPPTQAVCSGGSTTASCSIYS
jgi:Flp pilus assembly protein TadG